MAGRRSSAGAIAWALVFTTPLLAQGPPTADTLLARLTAEAIAANPGLAGLSARERAATARIKPAGALPDPMVGAGLMNLELPRFAFTRSDFTEVDVEARQEFPWPGTLAARTRAARASAEERHANVAVRRREVVVQIATLYHRLRFLVAAREILSRRQALLDAAVEIATARYGTGAVPQSDPLAARVARARLRSEEAALIGEEGGLRARLRAIRAAGPESLSVTPLRAEDVRTLYPSLQAHPHGGIESLEQNPLMSAHRAAVIAAEETARAEAFGARPDFEIMARYGARTIAADFFSTSVGLRVPLWAGRKQRQLADAARQDANAERAALTEQRAQLTAEFEATLAEAAAGLERLRVLLDEVLPSAEASQEAALRGYRVGQTDFQVVLAAVETHYQAQLDAAEVAAEHLTHLVMLEQLTREEEAR